MAELRAGLEMAWRDKAFASMLGVTFIANFNYWSHVPLLQVLATNLEASPTQTGLLVSGSGCKYKHFLDLCVLLPGLMARC